MTPAERQRAQTRHYAEHPIAADDQRHGKYTTYVNYSCRCDACREAWATKCAEVKRRRTLAPDDQRHGKYTTYGNYSCRCDACREAWVTYGRNRKAAA